MALFIKYPAGKCDPQNSNIHVDFGSNFRSPPLILSFFDRGALFRGNRGPPVLKQPARHLSRQGRGFVRPPVCPTPAAFSSAYGGASGGQLTDCWHQMSSYGQYILFLCCYCRICMVQIQVLPLHNGFIGSSFFHFS